MATTETHKCIRFQYEKGAVNPPPFETLPFYLVKIRSFLKRNIGHTAWFKGNAGGERAAWLVYEETLSREVSNLLAGPLDAGGFFKVTATLDDVNEIIKRYLIRDQVDIVGGINIRLNEKTSAEVLPHLTIGSREPPTVGARPWWEKYDWSPGFFYHHIQLAGRWQFHHIAADYASSHQDKKGVMLGLHNAVETAIEYRGKDPPSLWALPHPDNKDKGPTFWLWEQSALGWIQENVTVGQIRSEEPEWDNFLDAIKIGE